MSKVTEIPTYALLNASGKQRFTPDLRNVGENEQISTDGWFDGYGDMLTVDDLSVILHVSRKTVQNQCRRGDLPAIPIGRRWYVPKAHLVEFLTTGRKPGATE